MTAEKPEGLVAGSNGFTIKGHDEFLESVGKDAYFEGVRYYSEQFVTFIGGNIIDYEVPEIGNAKSFLVSKDVGSNIDIYLIPGGKGQVCLSVDDFLTESPIPVNLIKPLADNGINCHITNSIDILPFPFKPYLPLDLEDPDDLIAHRHWLQLISIIKQRYQPGRHIFLCGHSSSGLSLQRLTKLYHAELEQYVSGLIVMAPKFLRKDQQGGYGPIVKTLPVLAVHHTLDACAYTPIDTHRLYFKACRSPLSKFVCIEGGQNDSEDPCWNATYHAFHKTEDKLVKEIVDFVNSVVV